MHLVPDEVKKIIGNIGNTFIGLTSRSEIHETTGLVEVEQRRWAPEAPL
jgi:hypothetical protein